MLWFSAILLSFVSCLYGETVNTDVSQVFDASTSVVRYSAEIKASEVAGDYQLIFPNSWAQNLAFLSVTSKGKQLDVKAPVSNVNYTIFAIESKTHTISWKVQAVFTGLLIPYPEEITQSENQLVKLHASHYFYSPYPTTTQKTVFKLASASVESYTKLAPHAARGSSIHFGPFKDTPALAYSPLMIHYLNNFPFAKFSTMQREVEVSHWGNVAVEEIYELKHAGAALKGGFSRFDYQMRRNAPSPSFRGLVGRLPSQASNIYYRDQIGNISTSDIRPAKTGEMELDLQMRFPIFGGWQTQFYLGYSLPTELVLFTDSAETDLYRLKFDFFTIFKDVWVEDMEVKVILPEGAADIKVDVPYVIAEHSRTTRFTYLDSKLGGGRPVLILKAKNLVPEHDKQVTISYRFSKQRLFIEPSMLVIAFFVLFVITSLLNRTTAIATVPATSSDAGKNGSSVSNS